MFEIVSNDMQEAVIKVIGVGGCGGNAIDHMIEHGVGGVEFIVANTDAQALKVSKAKNQIQLGGQLTRGLGAGANPDIGRDAALEDRERIIEMIEGADMLFITAGMGGGTGTGAAPVVASIAKELDILTVAVVTKPFMFEGKRTKVAQAGIAELSKYVDSLIVVPNEKLMQVLGDDVTLLGAYEAANNVLNGAVAGIAEVINCPGLVNVDFADVRTVMSEMGMAMMGSATATGPQRAKVAAEQAVASPLLEDVNLSGARGVLVNITASSSFKMKEMHDVMNTIKAFAADEVQVFVGNVINDDMGESLRVTVVRTGTDNVPLPTGEMDAPSVFRGRGGRDQHAAQVEAMRQSGVDMLDIPAFLRKQAD
ncbi:MAG TPA: cell division protein FtsZ [Methylophilaceae bacterium]|nr:cell division protein FtsZ [Methylophilaceae bacterium]